MRIMWRRPRQKGDSAASRASRRLVGFAFIILVLVQEVACVSMRVSRGDNWHYEGKGRAKEGANRSAYSRDNHPSDGGSRSASSDPQVAFRFREDPKLGDITKEGISGSEFLANMDADDAASVASPLGTSVEKYRDEFIKNAQYNLPVGIPGFKPLGRHWPLDGQSYCGSVSFPLPGAPVFVEGGMRTRYLSKFSELGLSSGFDDIHEREGQTFTSKTYEYALGLSVGIKFFKFSASLKGSTTLNSFSIREPSGLDSLYQQALWPMLKARVLANKDKMEMLTSRSSHLIDSLRRPGIKEDTAATRQEIKEGWLHQLLHRVDKEIAQVGFEAMRPLAELRRLAKSLDGSGDKDAGELPEVLHNGYPLRVMRITDYGFFKATAAAINIMWQRRNLPTNNRLTRAQELMGMLRHLVVRLVYRFTEAVGKALFFGPMKHREQTISEKLSANLWPWPSDKDGKHGDRKALFPEIDSLADRKVRHWRGEGGKGIFGGELDPGGKDAPREEIKGQRQRFQAFLDGREPGIFTRGKDVHDTSRCHYAPMWFEGTPLDLEESEEDGWMRTSPDTKGPEVYGRLLCFLLEMREDSQFSNVLLDSSSNPCTSDSAQMSPLGCYEAGATRSWFTGTIKKNLKNKCAWLEDGRAMDLESEIVGNKMDASLIDTPQSESSAPPSFKMKEIPTTSGDKAKAGKTNYAHKKEAPPAFKTPSKPLFCKKMCRLLPTKCRGNDEDSRCLAALNDPKSGKALRKSDKKFCETACSVGFQALLDSASRKSCEKICISYLESSDDQILQVEKDRSSGITKCCSKRRLQVGKDGKFACQVDATQSGHAIRANGPLGVGDKKIYRLQFPHVYKNKRTQLCTMAQLGFEKGSGIPGSTNPSDCYISVPLAVANAFPEAFKAFHRIFELMGAAQKRYGENLRAFMKEAENTNAAPKEVDFTLISSGIEPRSVLYLIDALEALVTGPDGVFGFKSIDEIEELNVRMIKESPIVRGTLDHTISVEDQAGARRAFKEWANKRWAKRQWSGRKQTGDSLELNGAGGEDIEAAVKEARRSGQRGELLTSVKQAAVCEACTFDICNRHLKDEQEKKENRKYLRIFSKLTKTNRDIDSCKRRLKQKNETCSSSASDCIERNRNLAKGQHFCRVRLPAWERRLLKAREKLSTEKYQKIKSRIDLLNDRTAKGIQSNSANMAYTEERSVCRLCPCCNHAALNTCPGKSPADVEERIRERRSRLVRQNAFRLHGSNRILKGDLIDNDDEIAASHVKKKKKKKTWYEKMFGCFGSKSMMDQVDEEGDSLPGKNKPISRQTGFKLPATKKLLDEGIEKVEQKPTVQKETRKKKKTSMFDYMFGKSSSKAKKTIFYESMSSKLKSGDKHYNRKETMPQGPSISSRISLPSSTKKKPSSQNTAKDRPFVFLESEKASTSSSKNHLGIPPSSATVPSGETAYIRSVKADACSTSRAKGLGEAFKFCRSNGISYEEPTIDSDGDTTPGDYDECLLRHAVSILESSAHQACKDNCMHYLTVKEQQLILDSKAARDSKKGVVRKALGNILGFVTKRDPFPDPQFEQCPSAFGRSLKVKTVGADGPAEDFFRNSPTSLLSEAFRNRVLLKAYHPTDSELKDSKPSSEHDTSDLCLGMLSSSALEEDSHLALLPCSEASIFTLGVGALTPRLSAEMTSRTTRTFNIILEGDTDVVGMFPNRSQVEKFEEDLWKEALGVNPMRCMRAKKGKIGGTSGAVMSRQCCKSDWWGIRSRSLEDIEEERTGCMRKQFDGRSHLDSLGSGIGRWDLKILALQSTSSKTLKGGMLCTSDVSGLKPCSLCLAMREEGAALIPCKEGRHTMFTAVPEATWAQERLREKKKSLWEKVDLGNSLPRVMSSVRRVLSRLWSAKELQMGLGMLSRTLAGPQGRKPLEKCVLQDESAVATDTAAKCLARGACSWSALKNHQTGEIKSECVERYAENAAQKMDLYMASDPGPAIDWYGRVMAETRAKFEIIEGVKNTTDFTNQIRAMYSMERAPGLGISSVHEWCPNMCANVLESFAPLDDMGKVDYAAASQNPSDFELSLRKLPAMSSRAELRAIKALRKFIGHQNLPERDNSGSNAGATNIDEVDNADDPCIGKGLSTEASNLTLDARASGELSNNIVKCYLRIAIHAVVGAVVGPLDENNNHASGEHANAYTRAELDSVHTILQLMDKKGISLPHLFHKDSGLLEKLSTKRGGKCMSQVDISYLESSVDLEEDVQIAAAEKLDCTQFDTFEACEGNGKDGSPVRDGQCRWVVALSAEEMSREFRTMLEMWRVNEQDSSGGKGDSWTRRKQSVARAWTFATCGAAACYDGSGHEGKIMSLLHEQDQEAPKESKLSLAVTEKLTTGSIKSLGYSQLTQICRTRYIRGDDLEANFAIGSSQENFAFWADILPSISEKGPGQLHCSVSDQVADFSSKSVSHSRLFRESALLPCMYEDCLLPNEQINFPVRCQETERPNVDLVCGYKSIDASIKCNCDALRTCQGNQGGILGDCNSLTANVQNMIRRHPLTAFKVGSSIASLMAFGSFCIATSPTCYALAGFEKTAIMKPEGLFAGISKTYKCSETFGNAWSGIRRVIRTNVLARLRAVPPPSLPLSLSPGVYFSAVANSVSSGVKGWRGKLSSILGHSDPMPLPPLDQHLNVLPGSGIITLPGSCAAPNPVTWVNPIPTNIFLAAAALQATSRAVKWWSNHGVTSYEGEPVALEFQEGLPMYLVVETAAGYNGNDPSTWTCLRASTAEGDSVERAIILGPCDIHASVWRAERRELTVSKLHRSETFVREEELMYEDMHQTSGPPPDSNEDAKGANCFKRSFEGDCLVCCQQLGFEPNWFVDCDRPGMLRYKVVDDSKCLNSEKAGRLGYRMTKPAGDDISDTELLESSEFLLHTQSYLSYVDRSADGPAKKEPRPPHGMLWQKSCLIRKKLHSKESPVTAGKCDGMLGDNALKLGGAGSLHWSLKVNGMLCQDRCKNCITVENDTVSGRLVASIKHCKDIMPPTENMINGSFKPSTRIIAKTLPLEEVDHGLGPSMVTTVCDFTTKSNWTRGTVQEYVNDIWPLRRRAAYCESQKDSCIYNARAGHCHPRKMSINNTVSPTTESVIGTPVSLPDASPLPDPESDYTGGCQSAGDEVSENESICPICLQKSSRGMIIDRPTAACLYCGGNNLREGMCLSQLDVIALFNAGKLAETCTTLHAGLRFFSKSGKKETRLPGIGDVISAAKSDRYIDDLRKDNPSALADVAPEISTEQCPLSRNRKNEGDIKRKFTFIENMPSIPDLRKHSFTRINEPLHSRPLLELKNISDAESVVLPNLNPNGNQELPRHVDPKAIGGDERHPAEDWSFSLLDGIDDIEGSLNRVLERKVEEAQKSKCGTQEDPPIERFGRCAEVTSSMELSIGFGASINDDFCDPNGGGSAKEWSVKYSKRLVTMHTITGHVDIRYATKRRWGSDWILGTPAEVIVLDGVTTELRKGDLSQTDIEDTHDDDKEPDHETASPAGDQPKTQTEPPLPTSDETALFLETLETDLQKAMRQSAQQSVEQRKQRLRGAVETILGGNTRSRMSSNKMSSHHSSSLMTGSGSDTSVAQKQPQSLASNTRQAATKTNLEKVGSAVKSGAKAVGSAVKSGLKKSIAFAKRMDDVLEFKVPFLPLKVLLVWSKGSWEREGRIIPKGFNLFLTYEMPVICPLPLGVENWIWWVGRLLFDIFEAIGSVITNVAKFLNDKSNGIIGSIFKQIGKILMAALKGLYGLLKAVWDEIGDEVSSIFSTVLGWMPNLDLVFQSVTWQRRTRFVMNTNIRTDLKSTIRIRDRVETSMELICTRPIDVKLGMLGTGGARVMIEKDESFDLGNLFNQILYLPKALNPWQVHGSTDCASSTVVDMMTRVRGWVSATGVMPYIASNFSESWNAILLHTHVNLPFIEV